MLDCQITYILNIKKNTTGMPHLKKKAQNFGRKPITEGLTTEAWA